MTTNLQAWLKEFPDIFLEGAGVLERPFSAVRGPESASSGSVVFLSEIGLLESCLAQGVKSFVTSPKFKTQVSSVFGECGFLFTPNVLLALSQVGGKIFPDRPNQFHLGPGVHSTAIVHPSCQLGRDPQIGPYCVIGEGCILGDRVFLGPHTVLEGDVQIGDDTSLQAHVFVARRTRIGKNCYVKSHAGLGGPGYGFSHDQKGQHYRVEQRGRLVLEDRVEIGAGCMIDRATFDETRIGEGTKFDNLAHIAHNCKIGKNCLLTGGFMTAGSVTMGDNIITGGRTSITDHVTVCSNVQIGGLSGVSKDITEPGAYAGYPSLPIKDHLKSTASIAVLPRLRKDIARIIKHLGLKEDEK